RANDSTQTAYFGPYMTVRDGTVVTKHIFAGDERVATKIVPNLADEQCTNCTDGPSVLYFHSDHLGSTSFVSDATQTLVSRQEYFPSGEVWFDQDTTNTQGIPPAYLFNGKELDTETGLYYYGARYYDPRVQVWASPDPILAQYMRGEPGGGVLQPINLSLYSYAWNNRWPSGIPTAHAHSASATFLRRMPMTRLSPRRSSSPSTEARPFRRPSSPASGPLARRWRARSRGPGGGRLAQGRPPLGRQVQRSPKRLPDSAHSIPPHGPCRR
ncbi:MAG: RHS repeat-associated core domain-containing protein, partial [Polyangiaceae bacterium]|nr:RHS repeat-associated core domain-containing protein [Polyangiaceae bacterium]